jgi:hypothetical protein
MKRKGHKSNAAKEPPVPALPEELNIEHAYFRDLDRDENPNDDKNSPNDDISSSHTSTAPLLPPNHMAVAAKREAGARLPLQHLVG